MAEVINARFPSGLLKKVDALVARGEYRSRSDALRKIVELYLMDHPELFVESALRRILSSKPSMSDRELEKVGRELFKKPVVELVAEGRGR